MVEDGITLVIYVLNRLFDFLFSAYLLPGVSLGMIIVVTIVFGIILRYLLSVPNTMGGRGYHYEKNKGNKRNASNSNASH